MSVKELLEQLPDGVFISLKGRVAKIQDGKVTELKEVDDDVTIVPNLVGGNQDPGGGEEGGG